MLAVNFASNVCGGDGCSLLTLPYIFMCFVLTSSNKRGFTPRDLAERRGVSGSVSNLLCQLELEAKEGGGQDHMKVAASGVSHARSVPFCVNIM